MGSFTDKINYYIKSSYRRQLLDRLLRKYQSEYKGFVLDIGGRDRGGFVKPKTTVDKWVFADIEPSYMPDILTDVTDMKTIGSDSFDVVNAMELFEHVESVEKGISECYRVLKPSGTFMLSAPFLYQIHADPYDFQRWTETKWRNELLKAGFSIQTFEIVGRYFTVRNGMKKTLILSLPVILRHFAYLSFPVLGLINRLDTTNWIKNHKKLGSFHGGYFIIAKK
jgi:SAM-dependent methyltransferase